MVALSVIARGGWIVILSLAIGVSAGCDGRRAKKTPRAVSAPAPVVDEPPPPVVHEPVRPPPPPPPPPVARPTPPRPPAPRDDRLGACGPGKGPRYAVHGVDEQDTLNVRAQPDAQGEVLGQLSPHATGVLSLGQRRRVGASTWHKVRCGAVVGWVNEHFLAAGGGATPGKD